MTDAPLVEIRLTPEFQRRLKVLVKRYRSVRVDLQPIFEELQAGQFVGDQIPGVGSTVMKVRLKNSDAQTGKSGGYRLIYWIVSPQQIVLLDIYSKSDRSDIEIADIRQIIQEFDPNSEN